MLKFIFLFRFIKVYNQYTPDIYGIDSLLEARDIINWLGSYPSSPVLEPVKEQEVPTPTQSVNEYIKTIKLYAVATGKDVDDVDIKNEIYFFEQNIAYITHYQL